MTDAEKSVEVSLLREHVIGRGPTHMSVAEHRQGTVRGSVLGLSERVAEVAALYCE